MPKPSTGRLAAAVLVLVGAMLLIAALLTPWYSFDTKWAGNLRGDYGTRNFTYYLGPPSANGTIHITCSGP